jgi:hypothetical protein
VISFTFYADEDGAEGTAVFIFSDAETLDLHMDLAGSRFQEGYELLGATDSELLGPRATGQLRWPHRSTTA